MSDYTKGLRDLADWLDAHPNWSTPQPILVTFYKLGELAETPETLSLILCEMSDGGSVVHKEPRSNTFALARHFGPVTLRYVALRSNVCVSRVVGTRRIEASFFPAHDEKVVEWDCPPVLSEEKPA